MRAKPKARAATKSRAAKSVPVGKAKAAGVTAARPITRGARRGRDGASARGRSAGSPPPATRRGRPASTRAGSGSPTKTRPAVRPPSRGILVPLVVVAVIAFSIWSFYPVARVQYREVRQKAKLEAELSALKERNARLSKEVARLKTPEGIEDVARDNLGLVKQGEHAVVVVDPSRDSTPTGGTTPSIDREPDVAAPRGPWTPALDAFFGYHE